MCAHLMMKVFFSARRCICIQELHMGWYRKNAADSSCIYVWKCLLLPVCILYICMEMFTASCLYGNDAMIFTHFICSYDFSKVCCWLHSNLNVFINNSLLSMVISLPN